MPFPPDDDGAGERYRAFMARVAAERRQQVPPAVIVEPQPIREENMPDFDLDDDEIIEDDEDEEENEEEHGAPPAWVDDVLARAFDPPKVRVVPPLDVPQKHTSIPRFRLDYESLDEMRLRLKGTIITVHDEVVYVYDVGTYTDENTGRNGPGLALKVPGIGVKYIVLSPHGLNLRSIEPGYFQYRSGALNLSRVPARLYKQGINSENAVMRPAGKPKGAVLSLRDFNVMEVVEALNKREGFVDPSKAIYKLESEDYSSMRLSNRIALYKCGLKYKSIAVEYRGRMLGVLQDKNTVLLGPNDINCPWIIKSLDEVQLPYEARE